MTGVAAAVGVAGAVGSAVVPKLFSGSGTTSGTTSGGGSTSQQSGPAQGTPYLNFENQQLNNISGLSTQPFSPYDVNSMFAPLNGTQQQAFGEVANAQNSWQPAFGQASAALGQNQNPAFNPVAAGSSGYGSAQSTPTALGTANPYFSQGDQTAPSVINSYLNPNINNTVAAGNQLQTQNFLQNTMPGLTNQFVASGGGLGSSQMGNAQNWALTNFNQNLGNTDQAALSTAYNNSMNQAQTDLSRQAGIGSSAGSLANSQLSAYTGLGSAMGNTAATGNQANINNANAYAGLGTGALSNSLLGANALLQTGNQMQQNAQNPLTAAYQQFEQGVQWPYQTAGFAANTANSYNWPTATNTQSQNGGATSGTIGQTGSPVGTGVGLASAVGSVPGLASSVSNLFSGTSGGQQFGPPAPQAKRGGYFKFASGGAVPPQGFYGVSDGYSRDLRGNVAGGGDIGGFFGLTRNSMPPQAQSAFKTFYDDGGQVQAQSGSGYEDLLAQLAMGPLVSADVADQGGYADGGYLGINRAELPWKIDPRPENIYAKGGYLGIDVPQLPNAIDPDPENIYAKGGYFGMNCASAAPQAQPAFRGYYSTGGTVPVIKIARANTKRSLKAAAARQRAAEMQAAISHPDLDLSARSGHFSQ